VFPSKFNYTPVRDIKGGSDLQAEQNIIFKVLATRTVGTKSNSNSNSE